MFKFPLELKESHARNQLALGWGGLVAAVGLDQATKWWASQQGWVHHNAGLSLGWGQTWPAPLKIMVLLGGTMVLGWWWWQTYQKRRRFGLTGVIGSYNLASALFWAGILSNLLDRALFSLTVRDWMSLPWFHISNNLADWYIGVGLSALIWFEAAHYTSSKK